MPTYRIVLTLEAERQLAHEMRYSRQRWGNTHQQNFRRELKTYLTRLADNPHVHRERPDSFNVRVARWKGIRIAFLLKEDERRMVIVTFVGRNQLIENALPDEIKTENS